MLLILRSLLTNQHPFWLPPKIRRCQPLLRDDALTLVHFLTTKASLNHIMTGNLFSLKSKLADSCANEGITQLLLMTLIPTLGKSMTRPNMVSILTLTLILPISPNSSALFSLLLFRNTGVSSAKKA